MKFGLLYTKSLSEFYGTAECTASDAFKHAGENIVFASGSPFANVDLGMFFPHSRAIHALDSKFVEKLNENLTFYVSLLWFIYS